MSNTNFDSTTIWNEKSDQIVCPYDHSHVVRRSRIPYHIVKCSARHKHIHLEVCPYNASHRVPEAQMVSHIANCPDKHKIELLTPSEFVQPGKNCIPHSEFVRSRFEMDRFQSDAKKTEGCSIRGIQVDDSSDLESLNNSILAVTGRLSQEETSGLDECDLTSNFGFGSSLPNRRRHPQLRPLHSLPDALSCLLVHRRGDLG